MNIEGVPDSITREQLCDWLRQIGLDPNHIACSTDQPGVTVTRGAIICEVYAVNEKGQHYAMGDGQVATHKVCIEVTDESRLVSNAAPVLSRAKRA